ncbi:Lipoprotein [Clostridiaceae bacterium BL-3]|nr:Lipoprotein [Clostridiaceae bacterium BL-3]
MNIKKILSLALILALITSFTACGNSENNSSSSATEEKKTITVGTSSTFKDLLTETKKEFDKDGYKLNIKIFDDLVTPNIALQEGSIDVNFYQHRPYLDQFNKNKGTNLEQYGTGILKYYMGIYSNKIKNLNQLKDGATVTVPNDPSNRGRALKVLETNGLIKLKSGVATPTKLDISENRKNLNIVEMDVMKLVTSLNDTDCAVINSIVAFQGGLNPKSALAYESQTESNKYSIVVALKKDKGDKKAAERLEKALKSKTVKKYLEEKYKGAITPLF